MPTPISTILTMLHLLSLEHELAPPWFALILSIHLALSMTNTTIIMLDTWDVNDTNTTYLNLTVCQTRMVLKLWTEMRHLICYNTTMQPNYMNVKPLCHPLNYL